MKTFLLILLVVFLSASIFSQTATPSTLTEEPTFNPPRLGMCIGASLVNIETGSASNVGVMVGFNMWNFYMDFGFNGAGGKGEQLDFHSSRSYSTNIINWYSINAGYTFFLLNGDFWITPTVGGVFSRGIYQDPIGWDTWFYTDEEFIPAAGLLVTYKTNEIYFTVGTGTTEIFKLSIGYIFM